MKSSIKNKFIKNFILIITTIIIIIDILIIISFKQFNYKIIEINLNDRLNDEIYIYNRFYLSNNLDDLLINNKIIFGNDLENQLLNTKGFIVLDTLGNITTDKVDTIDVKYAIENRNATWIGKNPSTKELLMSKTKPIRNSKGDILGYLRMIISLKDINKFIIVFLLYLLLLSLFLIIISIVIISKSTDGIIKSINLIVNKAKKMANGDYKIKFNVKTNDELEQISTSLNTLAEEIVKKEQIKNDFISSVSHELRTPLTSIKGWAAVLKNTKPEEKEVMNEGINIIDKEIDRLSKMVEELLEFSKFASGRIKLENEFFNISETCIDVAKLMSPKADANKIDFQIDITLENIIFYGDGKRVRQLLINLLDNAIKFTSENGWVKFVAYKEENNFYIFVSDNGVGISKEDLLHVKEKFYKGKHSNSHSGLGLSITDEIVNLHKGKLEIFSEINIGTTIKITLPILENENEII